MTRKILLIFEFKGLPPTVNHMYNSRHGRRFRSKHTQEFQAAVEAGLKKVWNKPVFSGRAGLYLYFFQADRRHWDIDNRVKSVQDCLQKAGVIKDDNQIDILHVERVYGAVEARTKIILIQK